ncbi:MAG: ribose-5-phosphate isomerase RpiA [Burkholderiaceae bacterium]|jgi:ribose 5-phosphate isomerase A|nr:ribose-5-phosphate isomerase RpiA [Burkholderiaceae bacterium]
MSQDTLKLSVARAALAFVPEGKILGVGTGTTANFFIDELGKIKDRITGAVASSEATAARLRSHDIKVLDLNDVSAIPVYIDGADEINQQGTMIKGGGGALTREKIIASAADKFVCIADESKLVSTLGAFPLPVEVIPSAHALIARKLLPFGGKPILRMNGQAPYQTDNGNFILDIHQLAITNPVALENEINNMPGVVTVGLFAKRGADICLLGAAGGVKTLTFQ